MNAMAVMDRKKGMQAIQSGGTEAIVIEFMRAARDEIDLELLTAEYDKLAILDVDQGLEVLKEVGPDAFAVYFLLESVTTKKSVTICKIAMQLRMSYAQAESACARLGLFMLGIRL